MNSKRKIAIAASALAAFTSIVLITNQASASNSTPVTTPTVTSQSVPSLTPSVDAPEAGGTSDPAGVDVQSGDQTTADVAGAASETDSATSDPAGGVDVQSGAQSGDQTGPDVAGATDAGSNN